jgi:hypothetical protein
MWFIIGPYSVPSLGCSATFPDRALDLEAAQKFADFRATQLS